MVGHGYQRTTANYCVYFKRSPSERFFILLLYVDDMLTVGQDKAQISKLKEKLAKSFDMKDLSPAKQMEDYGYHKKVTLNKFLKCST